MSDLSLEGPLPQLKLKTDLSRLASHLPSIMLLSLAPTTAHPPTTVIPPLVLSAFQHAVAQCDPMVRSYYEDQEADARVAEIAARENGYILGLDSDYMILGGGEGRGYVELLDMLWVAKEEISNAGKNDGDDGFTPVKGSRKKQLMTKRLSRPHALSPPGNIESLTISAYHPRLLAEHLGLPLPLLPLFAALVGNDYASFHLLFFQRHLTSAERTPIVAEALRSVLAQQQRLHARKKKIPSSSSSSTTGSTAGDEAFDFLTSAIEALLLHPPLSTEKLAEVHSALISSTMAYTLPPHPSVSAYSLLTPACRPAANVEILALYEAAASEGKFSPKLVTAIRDGIYLGRVVVEDLNERKSGGIIYGGEIREVAWGVLEEGVGIGLGIEEEPQEEDVDAELVEGEEEDDEEMIDVVEETSDEEDVRDVSPLGAVEIEEPSTAAQKPSTITEYYPSATRIISKLFLISPLPSLAKPSSSLESEPCSLTALQPFSARLALFLSTLNSAKSLILALPAHLQLLAAIIRHVVVVTSRSAPKHRLTRHEVSALVFAGVEAYRHSLPSQLNSATEAFNVTPLQPVLSKRSIFLSAALLHTLDSSLLLSQALLLTPHLPSPSLIYSGRTLHSYLATSPSTWTKGPDGEQCLEAVLDGLEVGALRGDEGAKRKGKKEEEKTNIGSSEIEERVGNGKKKKKNKGQGSKIGGGRGAFDLLMNMEN